jgi:hypothetical protein
MDFDDLGLDGNIAILTLVVCALFWVLLWVIVPAIGLTTWQQFPWHLRLAASVLIVPIAYVLLSRIIGN